MDRDEVGMVSGEQRISQHIPRPKSDACQIATVITYLISMCCSLIYVADLRRYSKRRGQPGSEQPDAGALTMQM